MLVNEYNDTEKEFLDNTCSRLRLTEIGTNIQELQQKINSNENIGLEYNNQTGILKIIIDNVEKANVNLGLEKYVSQASIVNNPQGQPAGKYIKLEFEGGANPIFIPTADIGKIYSAGTGINIDSNGVISCTLDLSDYYNKTDSNNRFINLNQIGANNGVASLNNNGKVPLNELPDIGGDVPIYAVTKQEYNALSSQERAGNYYFIKGNPEETDLEITMPRIDNLISGSYLYRSTDINRPIPSINEDQWVIILGSGEWGFTNIAIITTRAIDKAGQFWIACRNGSLINTSYSNANNSRYTTPVEIIGNEKNYLNIISHVLLNNNNFSWVSMGTNLMTSTDRNLTCFYDWNSGNKPFSVGGRGVCFLIQGDINQSYTQREAYILGFMCANGSSHSPPFKFGIRRKPNNSNNWDAEFTVTL